MSAPALELVHVSRDFGSRRAVDDVSLSVSAGEVVGLLGPNGAGKTTALRVLAGLLRATSGTAHILGEDVHARPREARRSLGFLTGSTGLPERLTGLEVLEIFGRLQGLEGAALRARVEAVSQELELAAFLQTRCGVMSAGQRQRISLGRAIVHDPRAIVLDEPTAMLDPVASKDILQLVRRSRDAGRAVLFSTHRMEEAELLCSRLYFLRAGRVVAQGSTRELLAQSGQSSLTEAFLALAGAAA